jgi:hypothetical protein
MVAPYQFGPRTTSNGRTFGPNRNQHVDWVE